jgi:hypothetical protein
MEVCRRAPHVLSTQGRCQGSKCTTELFPYGLSLPIQVRIGYWQMFQVLNTNLALILVQSGRTEVQTIAQNRSRRTVQFERRPSQRYARRQSHILRERQRPAPRDLPLPTVEVESEQAKRVSRDVDVDLLLCDEPRVLRPRSRPSSPSVGAGSLSPPQTPTSRSTPSPIQPSTPPSDDPLDSLIKSIAKEAMGYSHSHAPETSSVGDSDVNVVPNNQTKYISLPKPLPPDQLKCNIWKAQNDEDLKKEPAPETNSHSLFSS